jgi:hypothetical protein
VRCFSSKSWARVVEGSLRRSGWGLLQIDTAVRSPFQLGVSICVRAWTGQRGKVWKSAEKDSWYDVCGWQTEDGREVDARSQQRFLFQVRKLCAASCKIGRRHEGLGA